MRLLGAMWKATDDEERAQCEVLSQVGAGGCTGPRGGAPALSGAALERAAAAGCPWASSTHGSEAPPI
jgi:hypothetical protein